MLTHANLYIIQDIPSNVQPHSLSAYHIVSQVRFIFKRILLDNNIALIDEVEYIITACLHRQDNSSVCFVYCKFIRDVEPRYFIQRDKYGD